MSTEAQAQFSVERIAKPVRGAVRGYSSAELARWLLDRDMRRVVKRVKRDRLTFLRRNALIDLYASADGLEKRAVGGIFVEAGCALGGSAVVIASAKSASRPFYIYDVFGMIPPPSENDGVDVQERYKAVESGASRGIGGDKYYGYEENLYDRVKNTFAAFDLPVEANNIKLIKGLFQETMKIQTPVALAHLDGDWYESTMTCLQQIVPNLASGGELVIDDYQSWSGCRKAVDEYFADKAGQFSFEMKARLHVTRR